MSRSVSSKCVKMATGSSSAERAGYAALLVAYGSPNSLEEVGPYLLDVRGGRDTGPELVTELRQRYSAIGGRSPLLERTREQADGLRAALGGRVPVYVGMRHWHPYIADTLTTVRNDGHARVVAVPMAPHFSRMSVGAYQRQLDVARGSLDVVTVREWFDHPGFLDAVAARVREGLARFDVAVRPQVTLLFTAHSLPRRILADGDPYPAQLQASVAGVLRRVGERDHRFAYQSAGRSDEPWLGPDASEAIRELAAAGVRQVLVCPIGFVCDHLEVLYDVDLELAEMARALGVRLARTASLNDSPLLSQALADLVRRAASEKGWS